MTIWITSDQHFWHTNVIQYCDRPFANNDQMDNALVDAWNSCVKPSDLVYHLGDFTLGNRLIAEQFFKRLNGYIRVLEYPWHHDRKWLRMQLFISASMHEVVYDRAIVALEHEADVPVILCHFAFEIWDRRHYNSIHLHGHSHGMLPPLHNRLDVGVDNAYKLLGEYRPFSLEEAIEFAKNIV